MLTVAELWKLIDSAVRPLPTLRVPLEDAVGRRLAENVAADADLPAFSRSSIDGFLVREGARGATGTASRRTWGSRLTTFLAAALRGGNGSAAGIGGKLSGASACTR